MKVIITSTGKEKESLLDERFGRAKFFAIYDKKTGNIEFHENTGLNAAHGAGTDAVRFVADKGANMVAGINFGDKAQIGLEQANIEIKTFKPGTKVSDVISSL